MLWHGRPREDRDHGPPGTAWRVDSGPKLRPGTVLDVVLEFRYGRDVFFLEAPRVTVAGAS